VGFLGCIRKFNWGFYRTDSGEFNLKNGEDSRRCGECNHGCCTVTC
jgi:hypothetical protein